MTFLDAMLLTRTVSSNAAFEDPECEAYFNILNALPKNSLVVEVGLEFGRSSSIALQVAKANGLRYHGVDPFIQADVFPLWMKMARGYQPFRISVMRSQDVVIGESISAILIDGDHEYEAVKNDCEHFLPQVIRDGYALFHDFGRQSLPAVYNAVKDYMDGNQRWEHVKTVGTLGIWRKRA